MKPLLYLFLMLLPFIVYGNNESNEYGGIKGLIFTADGYPASGVSVQIKNERRE